MTWKKGNTAKETKLEINRIGNKETSQKIMKLKRVHEKTNENKPLKSKMMWKMKKNRKRNENGKNEQEIKKLIKRTNGIKTST